MEQQAIEARWDVILRWANNGNGYQPGDNNPITGRLFEPKVPDDVAAHWRALLAAQGFIITDNAGGTQTISRPASKPDLRFVEPEGESA